MKMEDVQKLPFGAYIVRWKDSLGGGTSLASVGFTHNGTRWMAPCNWVNNAFGTPEIIEQWEKVESVEMVVGAYSNPVVPRVEKSDFFQQDRDYVAANLELCVRFLDSLQEINKKK